jgi:two-component system, cell cycle sensor histidine kinase and response regulator CckA
MTLVQDTLRLVKSSASPSAPPETLWRLEEEKRVALARMAGGVARHLGNLLTVIQGSAEQALEEAADPGIQEELLEILDACARGSHLSSRLLAISGRHWREAQVVDLRKVVLAVDFGPLLSEEVAFCMDLPATPCLTLADPVHLRQVVAALILNAREAVGNRGIVGLSVDEVSLGRERAGGRWARLEVTDNGNGMDGDTAARALDPFFTTKPDRPDGGLGLSVVHGIVRQSGGAMFLDSAPECGTTVTIWLPSAGFPRQLPPAH